VKFTIIGDPRQPLPNEVDDLAPWLIDNLEELGEQVGMRLRFVDREVSVGGLRADILAEDEQGRRVIIETQFGPSDHRHLGQIVTYACAGDAEVVVWVVTSGALAKGMREEHLATLSTLNEVFAGRTAFHAVEVVYMSDPTDSPSSPAARAALSLRMRVRHPA
jgi:hypothetical protein